MLLPTSDQQKQTVTDSKALTAEEISDSIDDFLRGDIVEPPLLPCPFCGQKAGLGEEGPDSLTFVQCTHCNASSAAWLPIKQDARRNAIESWNRRADLATTKLPAGTDHD